MIFDAAARLFVFESVDKMMRFFTLWNDITVELYEKDKIKLYGGWYAKNDEHILAPIYNSVGLKSPHSLDEFVTLFNVKHNSKVERFLVILI